MNEQLGLILLLLQQMCVYLVIAYLLSKTPLFIPLTQVTIRLPHKLLCYAIFSVFCILGTYFSLPIDDSYANTRAIGAVLGGLLGGPSVGFAVGLTGGFHRYSLGGVTALACMVSTITEGLIGGAVHRTLIRRGRVLELFSPLSAGLTAFAAEIAQQLRPVSAFGQVGPRDEEHVSHADARGAAIERIAARSREQHRVHAERGGGAEDRADVRRIHHVFEHDEAPRIAADVLDALELRPPHGAEHAARQVKAGELCQHGFISGVNRNILTAAGENFAPLALSMLPLHQKRHRLTARIKRTADDERTFRDEERVVGIRAIEQLVFGQARVDVERGIGKIVDFDDVCHRSSFLRF